MRPFLPFHPQKHQSSVYFLIIYVLTLPSMPPCRREESAERETRKRMRRLRRKSEMKTVASESAGVDFCCVRKKDDLLYVDVGNQDACGGFMTAGSEMYREWCLSACSFHSFHHFTVYLYSLVYWFPYF